MLASHKVLSNWFRQLGDHLEAGIPLPEAIRSCPGPPKRKRAELAAELGRGRPLAEVLRHGPSWFPAADRWFLIAAETTGRLPPTLKNLSERHAQLRAALHKFLFSLIYPVLLYHFAALLLPLPGMIDYEKGLQWDPVRHATISGTLILVPWVLFIGGFFLAKKENPLHKRLLRLLPLLRRHLKARAWADFSHALGTFIEAGVPVPTAWKTAVRVAADPGISKPSRSLAPIFEAGGDPSAKLRELGDKKRIPADFVSFYTSGAQSGHLDSMLHRAAGQFQERADRALTMAAVFYGSLVFLLVAGFALYTIFRIYGGYLDTIRDML